MSESPDSVSPDPLGGPISRPQGEGLPPKTDGDLPRRGGDAVNPGMEGEGGDRGQDTGGMAGEG